MDLLNFIRWHPASLSIHAVLTRFPELIYTMAIRNSQPPPSSLLLRRRWKCCSSRALAILSSSTLLCTHTTTRSPTPSLCDQCSPPTWTHIKVANFPSPSPPPSTTTTPSPTLLRWRLADPQVTFFLFQYSYLSFFLPLPRYPTPSAASLSQNRSASKTAGLHARGSPLSNLPKTPRQHQPP